eukprot:gb/GFBE01043251.1/.p1 GENE.gb/GFBE01043251.1/~~gb/GFBE01043251.1/.p1  ORF type:complete len:254 (+),score=56.92 gb/GFBE01043251.1/:1-762(+)
MPASCAMRFLIALAALHDARAARDEPEIKQLTVEVPERCNEHLMCPGVRGSPPPWLRFPDELKPHGFIQRGSYRAVCFTPEQQNELSVDLEGYAKSSPQYMSSGEKPDACVPKEQAVTEEAHEEDEADVEPGSGVTVPSRSGEAPVALHTGSTTEAEPGFEVFDTDGDRHLNEQEAMSMVHSVKVDRLLQDHYQAGEHVAIEYTEAASMGLLSFPLADQDTVHQAIQRSDVDGDKQVDDKEFPEFAKLAGMMR